MLSDTNFRPVPAPRGCNSSTSAGPWERQGTKAESGLRVHFSQAHKEFCFLCLLLFFELLLARLPLFQRDAWVQVCCFKQQPEEHWEEQNNYLAALQQPDVIDFCSIDHPPPRPLCVAELFGQISPYTLCPFVYSFLCVNLSHVSC